MSTRKTDGQGREFWICQTEGYDGDAYDTDPDTWNPPGNPRGPHRHKFHVIEYSAHKAALDRLDEAEKVINLLYIKLSGYEQNPTDTHKKRLVQTCIELIAKWKENKNGI